MIHELKLAKQVAKDTAELLKLKYLGNVSVLTSKGKDIKTNADIAAHEYLFENLDRTGIKILSEESNDHSFDINDSQWIIDPVDGTLNFSRGFSMAAVSIALWNHGSPVLGVVHNIFSDQIFYASKNNGACLNGNKISVSSISKKQNAVIATGFPSGSDYSDTALGEFVSKVQRYKKVRMLGSASLMLAYVACGYFDIYKEDNIYIWDVAAGLALVAESRGRYFCNPGLSTVKFNVEASNSLLTD